MSIGKYVVGRHNPFDYHCCGKLFQHFCDSRLTDQGKQLHTRFVLAAIHPDNYLASKLINFYSKSAKDIAAARNVFDRITEPNTFSYNALLMAYSNSNCYGKALQLFSSMLASDSERVFPDGYSVSCLLKSLVGDGFCDCRVAKEVHLVVMKNGLDKDIVVGNGLITYYSKCDDISSAKKVFDITMNKDVVTWNSMISGFSQAGCYEDCKQLFLEMTSCSAFKPDPVTVVSVLQACGQSKDLVFGMRVHKLVVDHNVEIDVSVCNALIALYAKCGSLKYALNLLEEISHRDEVTYNTLISSYMDHGYINEAYELFQRMETRGIGSWNALISGLFHNNEHKLVVSAFRNMLSSGIRPNSVTVASVLPALSHSANLKGGKEMHLFALKDNCLNNVYVATALMDTYAKSGFLSGARRVFEQLKQRNLMCWTSIISAYASHGDAESALKLFYEMLGKEIRPDKVVFVAVLASCAHSGLVVEAKRIFDAMASEFCIEPSVEHYACMVDVFGKSGKLCEAKKVVFDMPMMPSSKVWGALLNAAAGCGDIEAGEMAYRHLVETEPENVGNYVSMVNLYSQAGKWREADKVRKEMNCIGKKKIPGSSWTEKSKISL